MSVRFVLLGTLKDFCGASGELTVKGSTIREALESLQENNPSVGDSICDEHGRVRELINVFVGGKEIRTLSGEMTKLKDGEELIVIPSVAGGKE